LSINDLLNNNNNYNYNNKNIACIIANLSRHHSIHSHKAVMQALSTIDCPAEPQFHPVFGEGEENFPKCTSHAAWKTMQVLSKLTRYMDVKR